MKRVIVFILLFSAFFALGASAAVVVFEDEKFNGCVRAALGLTGSAVPVSDDMMANLETLSCTDEFIDNISGVEYAVNLQSFSLSASGNRVSSFAPLATLGSLTSVSAPNGVLVDLDDFSVLAGLTRLEVSGNVIEDIGGIEHLDALSTLLLDYNRITDLDPIDASASDNATGLRETLVGDGGAAVVSEEGAAYVDLVAPTTDNITATACASGTFVMVDDTGNAYYSPIGEGFFAAAMPVDVPLHDVIHTDGRYYAVGGSGTILTSANNGVAYSEVTVATFGVPPVLRAIAGDMGAMVAVGDGGRVLASRNGTSFAEEITATGADLNDVAYGGGAFVAVGDAGTVIVSDDDGDTWADRSLATTNDIYAVTFASGMFVLAGENGIIHTSTDGGGTWTTRTSGTLRDLFTVFPVDAGFLAAGELGAARTSADGITWNATTLPTTETFRGGCSGSLITATGNMVNLSVQGNPVSDITPVATHPGLRVLNVRDTGISSLAALSDLTNLVYLNASINDIDDVSPLDNLTRLTSLYLNNNAIDDISPLAPLTNLTVLHVMDNAIDNVSVAAGLPLLRQFWFDYNNVTDVSALEDHDSLLDVGLSFNCVDDMTPLRHIDIVRSTDQCENTLPEGDSDPGAEDEETGDPVYERVPLDSDNAGLSGAGCAAGGGKTRLDVMALILFAGIALLAVRKG